MALFYDINVQNAMKLKYIIHVLKKLFSTQYDLDTIHNLPTRQHKNFICILRHKFLVLFLILNALNLINTKILVAIIQHCIQLPPKCQIVSFY